VSRRAFDAARERTPEHAELPPARRITKRLGLPWQEIVAVAHEPEARRKNQSLAVKARGAGAGLAHHGARHCLATARRAPARRGLPLTRGGTAWSRRAARGSRAMAARALVPAELSPACCCFALRAGTASRRRLGCCSSSEGSTCEGLIETPAPAAMRASQAALNLVLLRTCRECADNHDWAFPTSYESGPQPTSHVDFFGSPQTWVGATARSLPLAPRFGTKTVVWPSIRVPRPALLSIQPGNAAVYSPSEPWMRSTS
jgi:hypothetical protein